MAREAVGDRADIELEEAVTPPLGTFKVDGRRVKIITRSLPPITGLPSPASLPIGARSK